MFSYRKTLTIFSTAYIYSLSLHYWSINFVRISELIFFILTIIFLLGIKTKFFKPTFDKVDIIISLFFLINLIIFIFKKNYFENIFGLLYSAYVFLIYYTYKNIFEKIDYKYFIKQIILLTLFTSFLSITGWILYQINIPNILVNERDYPFIIGKSVQTTALYVTPNLLSFSTIIGILFLILFNTKFKTKIILFLIFNLALFFTFSKSIIIYFGVLILIFGVKNKNKFLKKTFILISILTFFIHSFLTNFLLLDNSRNYEWLDNKYTHIESKPFYENSKIKIIYTNYYFLKLKSLTIIKDHYLFGIGYDNFKNQNEDFPILINQKPHSTYFGIASEYGILGLLSILIIFYYNFKIARDNPNNFIYLLIIYLIFEGINTDIISLKLTWLIFAFNIHINKHLNNHNSKVKNSYKIYKSYLN